MDVVRDATRRANIGDGSGWMSIVSLLKKPSWWLFGMLLGGTCGLAYGIKYTQTLELLARIGYISGTISVGRTSGQTIKMPQSSFANISQ